MKLVYYCSGHGYGHATRVSAFTCHLLRLTPQPTVYIVSSAPKHVFADSIALGALYRNANIDPVIVQPLAYRVDRVKSIEVLKDFLDKTPQKIEDEAQWLRVIGADCVLSDAAFLGCAAANAAGIPSALVTNFTFDSVYSYLSTLIVDETDTNDQLVNSLNAHLALHPPLPPDVPLLRNEVEPLVEHLWAGYRCADLLLRLPGAIPIPSFAEQPALPSPDWVDVQTRRFRPTIFDHLHEDTSQYTLLQQIPFPSNFSSKSIHRAVVSAPLLVRSPNPAIYTREGRQRLLDLIGVPRYLQDDPNTKILIVSFGGQIFHKPAPSRTHSRASSQPLTPDPTILAPSKQINIAPHDRPHPTTDPKDAKKALPTEPEHAAEVLAHALRNNSNTHAPRRAPSLRVRLQRKPSESLLMIPGAPAASVPSSPVTSTLPTFAGVVPPTPTIDEVAEPFAQSPDGKDGFEEERKEEYKDEVFGTLLPDASWVAVVCGVPKDWAAEDGEPLPENFFVAPKDVYMPDLTAVADVLLGKLGYGTVSECVDACTPFVYVPRPLFIEEHGLRMLLARDGVGIELSRTAYESGEWAGAVEKAYHLGKEKKQRKRDEGETGLRAKEGREMAEMLVGWVQKWQAQV
ncbi:hypothetical protein PsYK624_124600 [Phanerochaete sordida]|uniref:Uncharacterized protein n=1 Tax=Phanerochaete sordida TaxID=48140 RepID=A0A9P3LI78_9APHY|nr:hypothetical protein PsYK624_124600 [Phanerochaete sordida]